jgi:hypothetical protein
LGKILDLLPNPWFSFGGGAAAAVKKTQLPTRRLLTAAADTFTSSLFFSSFFLFRAVWRLCGTLRHSGAKTPRKSNTNGGFAELV